MSDNREELLKVLNECRAGLVGIATQLNVTNK